MCGRIHYFIFLCVIVECVQKNLAVPIDDAKSGFVIDRRLSDKQSFIQDPADLEIGSISQKASVHRVRRQQTRRRDDKNFVVDRGWEGDLFTVADVDDPVSTERFMFYDDDSASEDLELNPITGMVSRSASHQWNSTLEEVRLRVNVSRTDDPNFQEDQFVNVYLVERSYTATLFSQAPVPLRTTVPVWIRPDTTVLSLTALDADKCPIRYAIESGAKTRFRINSVSGELQISDVRAPFEENQVFEVAVSAMCKGSANRTETPAQVVYIHVGDREPQFYYEPYVIYVSEYTSASATVAQIQTKSFQGLPITYSWSADTPHDGVFSLDSSTGDITLNRAQVYVNDRHQYIFNVTAREQYSNFESEIRLVINIQPENRHTPILPPAVYSRRDVWESVATTEELVLVSMSDLDWKENGTVMYTTSNDNFRVDYVDDEIQKDGSLKADKELDYDSTYRHVYKFSISATDMAPEGQEKTGDVNAEVFVKNINDEFPVFDPASPVISVKEGAKANLKVYVIQAYDPDGDKLTFRFDTGTGECSSATVCDIFRLDGDNGIIYLNQDVPKPKANLELPIIATDDSSCCPGAPGNEIHDTEARIAIQFVGVNHPPVFEECRNYNARISEGKPVSSSVLNITATDDDAGSNGELTYSLVASAIGNYFKIDRQDTSEAEITTARVFDRESPFDGAVTIAKQQKYKVTVTATDNGTPQLSANCFLFVTIDDINDNAPIFDEVSYAKTIEYNQPLDSRILRVFAVDDDDPNTDNAKLDYSIEEDDPNCQGCVAFASEKVEVGWLLLKSTVAESISEINLRVKVEDRGSPPQSTTVAVKISFTKDGPLPPEWAEDYDTVPREVNETKRAGTKLDEEPTTKNPVGVIYTLIAGRTPEENSKRDFQYSGSPGDESMTIRVQTLDYETTPEYWLRLRASRGSLWSDSRMNIQLIDENDRTPVFEGLGQDGQYKGAVTGETRMGDYVFSVIAIDLDGTSPNNLVTYYFQPNCGDDCDAFSLDSDTGFITANSDYYDRSVQANYILQVRAEDGADSAITPGDPNVAYIQVTIEVIGSAENPPTFDKQSEVVQITEGIARNTTVADITANDPEPGYNIVQYGIEEGNDERLFATDFTTGRIYTVGDILHEEKQEYFLKYRVFDGEYIDSMYVNISIQQTNMYPPVFEDQEYENTNVVEHSSSPSRLLLGQVSATDPDVGRPGDIRYSLEGDYVNGRFSIDPNGNVYLEPNTELDRDYPGGTSNWQFNVVATDETGDGGGQPSKGYATFNLKLLDINDNAPIFDTDTIQGSVPESSDANTFVMKVVANDWDAEENGTVSYEVVFVPEDSLGRPLFKFDQTPSLTGDILTVNGNVLNREEQDVYYMIIKASDGGNPRKSVEQRIQITIDDVNDNEPIFEPSSYNLDVPEGMPFGSSVLAVYAKDADIGENAKLTYEILTATDNFYFDSIFAAGSGVLKIKEVIDYDTMVDKTINLNIRVSDPDFTDDASVTMTITDINDNAPEFQPPIITTTLPEDVAIDQSVATFTATDKDEGENAEFEYFIDYENTDPLRQFQIDPSTGLVTVRNKLDREEEEEHKVHVLAIDKGTPPMTGTATLVVTLSDVNDNAPDFAENYTPWVAKNAVAGDVVLRFSATDPDTDENGPPFTFTYICEDAAESGCSDFTLRRVSDTEGEIVAARDGYDRSQLDRKFYDLTIRMADSGSPTMSADRSLIVYIESQNDHDHSAASKRVRVYNHNGEFDNVNIGRVYCEDIDDWDIPDKTFELYGDNPDHFSVDRDEGEVTMRLGAKQGVNKLQFLVEDRVRQVSALCEMYVNVIYITDEAVHNAGSLRLSGITAEDFITPDETAPNGASKAELLTEKLSTYLGNLPNETDIFSIRNTPNMSDTVDVMFAAHGSPYYRKERLNGIIIANKDDIENSVGVKIEASPIDECNGKECWGKGCHNKLVISEEPSLVNTNKTAFVGLDSYFDPICQCEDYDFDMAPMECTLTTCLNGGTCTETWNGAVCTCISGFDGPRCQQLKHSFNGNSWAWFRTLTSCTYGKISLEFATTSSNGLLLYNGPIADTNVGDNRNYVSFMLIDGKIKISINYGEDILELSIANGAKELSDGQWHSVELIQEDHELRMVIDNCDNSIVNENINASNADRSMCEVNVMIPGENLRLQLDTPLELGGRSHPNVNFPDLEMQQGFDGCVRNVWQNGWLYDLHIGNIGQHSDSEDGCARDGCAPDTCPVNSTCDGSLNSDLAVCHCYPGHRGSDCSEDTEPKTFATDTSFIQWAFKDSWQNSTAIMNLQLMFRTRQENGIVFLAQSFSTLERIKVQVMDTNLHLMFDLGNGYQSISLPYVNVSDGIWHTVRINRNGNHVIMRLDGGEGKFYGESFPDSDFQLISFEKDELFGGANVRYNKYNQDLFYLEDVLEDSCIMDVRFEQKWFPLDPSENDASDVAIVENSNNMENGCDSDACVNVNCPDQMMCVDRWKMPHCSCINDDERVDGDVCVLITDCSLPRCDNGFCIVVDGNWQCDCYDGWQGEQCDAVMPVYGAVGASLANSAIAAIVVCIIVLLLILLLGMFLVQRSQPEKMPLVDPDEDIRDNVIYYDEEGAGEEDMHAYDLSRLQKPVDYDDPPYAPGRFEELPRMAPEPMTAERPPLKPGDFPDIENFIGNRMHDANNDPNAPPYDSVREYEYEGAGSTAGSLSSLQSSSSGDLNFDYLQDFGPNFKKLADIYGGDDEDTSSV